MTMAENTVTFRLHRVSRIDKVYAMKTRNDLIHNGQRKDKGKDQRKCQEKPKRTLWFVLPVLFLSAFIVAGCSSDSDDPDTDVEPIVDPEVDPEIDPEVDNDRLVATFPSIRENVLAVNCAFSGCHSGSFAPFGLAMDADVAYSNLVNVMSGQQADVVRVAPGDPDNSYLIQKLEGTATIGLQMPRGATPLPAETIQIIRDWIANGALES